MTKTNQTLTKTCSICGKPQPLSAFLQLAGPQGTTYGNVCATCRSAGLDKPKKAELDDPTRDATGFKIDSKAKVKLEKDKRDFRQHKEELDKEEQKKQVQKQSTQGAKKEKTAKEDRSRRETMRSFLDKNKRPVEKPSDAMADQAAKEQNIDTRHIFTDTYIPKLKQHSDLMKKFKLGLLGGSSPMAQSELKQTSKPTSEKEFLEKNFKPKSGR